MSFESISAILQKAETRITLRNHPHFQNRFYAVFRECTN